MIDFWNKLSGGQQDALIFVFVCACSVGMVTTAAIAIIITVSSYPT